MLAQKGAGCLDRTSFSLVDRKRGGGKKGKRKTRVAPDVGEEERLALVRPVKKRKNKHRLPSYWVSPREKVERKRGGRGKRKCCR